MAFALIHLISSGGQAGIVEKLLYLITPLGMGILGGALVVWKSNVWWRIGMHGATHLLDWLFGIVYPIENGVPRWISVGVGLTVVGVAILVLALKQRPNRDEEEYPALAQNDIRPNAKPQRFQKTASDL